MPDFTRMGEAVAVSAAAATLTLLLLAWPWRKGHPLRRRAAWVLALGAGFYAGCGVLGQWPRWPAPEDRDRFLTILLPLTLSVEIAAAFVVRPRWPVWLLRFGLAAAAAPILLYNSVYLADLSGPHSAEWPPAEAGVILALLAAALAGPWALLERLQARAPVRTAATALALASLAAAVTVMLSGYYQGGLLGLPLAGALAGGALASLVAPARAAAGDGLGFGVIALFAVLVIGRFFGSLPTGPALCLWLAPVLVWLPEAPGIRKLRPGPRAAARLLVVAVPLALVVANAKTRFAEASAAPSSRYEPSDEDFRSFRK